MYRTYTFPIYPNKHQALILDKMFDQLHELIKHRVKLYKEIPVPKGVNANLVPYHSLQYVDNTAKLIIKHKQFGLENDSDFYIKLKKHMYFKMVNFKITTSLSIKSKEGIVYNIPYRMTDYVKTKLNGDCMVSIKIFKKNKKYVASVLIKIKPTVVQEGIRAGLDIGVKVPAVLYSENQKIRFYKGGKYRRYLFSKQVSLLRNQNLANVRKIKVSRRLRDLDHKISSRIIKDLKKMKVNQLNLEDLKHIQTKNTKQLYSSWSYERLQKYIIYKCESNGISVKKVNPHFTSRECPVCSLHNVALRRIYSCECGFKQHRDVVGAMNIMSK